MPPDLVLIDLRTVQIDGVSVPNPLYGYWQVGDVIKRQSLAARIVHVDEHGAWGVMQHENFARDCHGPIKKAQ